MKSLCLIVLVILLLGSNLMASPLKAGDCIIPNVGQEKWEMDKFLVMKIHEKGKKNYRISYWFSDHWGSSNDSTEIDHLYFVVPCPDSKE